MNTERVAVVVGVGPGLGASIAKRFAKEGYYVAILARTVDKLTPVHDDIVKAGGKALIVPCDAANIESVTTAFKTVREKAGDPEVLVYNAGRYKRATILDETPAAFEEVWKILCYGAFLCTQQVAHEMVKKGRGTILLTGATASLRGGAAFLSLSVGKFGLRALSQSLARELGPKGIHVAHIIVDGIIKGEQTKQWFPDRPDTEFIDPNALADLYWTLHTQNQTVWTQELDIRPSAEKF